MINMMLQMEDGHAAVRALSWKEVDGIAERFKKLNPYEDKSRSILKIERDRYDPETGNSDRFTVWQFP